MFGPNVRADERGVYYHHRESMFHEILKSLENVFAKKFGLEDYDFLFITGSGTTANEIVIFSLDRIRFNFLFDDADFGVRLRKISMAYGRSTGVENVNNVAYPLYETSISRWNVHQPVSKFTFLDMVSAFPYYLPPKDTAIFTTVSSKQLGAYPVLGIIGILKTVDLGEYVSHHNGSSLNLLGHLFCRVNGETLATPAIPLYYDLLQKVLYFDRGDLIKKIDRRRRRIEHIVGIENVMGCGPVVTFRNTEVIKSVAVEFNLYKGDAGYQVFLWSGKDNDYLNFCEVLERKMKNG